MNNEYAKKLQGCFVVIDGPNAVGKSTIVDLVAQHLRKAGKTVLETKEPTPNFNRNHEETSHGLALAQLIVEDRKRHLIEDIEPALLSGEIVVCDRYVCASLVYRAFDGVPFEITWKDNKSFRVPDLSILLTATTTTIASRLEGRCIKSRFEREHSPQEEMVLYDKASHFLGRYGFVVRKVSNDTRLAKETAKEVLAMIHAIL